MLQTNANLEFVTKFWDEKILSTIKEYIRIPNKSPSFDPHWEKNGHMEKALQLVTKWLEANKPENSKIHILRETGRTPLIALEVEASSPSIKKNIMMYGHLDKQPEMTGWREGLSAWEPVLEGEKLYGRGGADDGYAVFASVAAIKSLQAQKIPHARIIALIEFSEESGSPDLPFYVEKCASLIQKPDLVVCLDSGAGNYDQLWCTSSLRGLVSGNLKVEVLKEGVHSGDASGIVASSFRIARQLLSRIENIDTGEILLKELHTEIPKERLEQSKETAMALKEEVYSKFPWVEGMKPTTEDAQELILRRTWRPALSVVGQEGLPSLENAGNVLRPQTTLKLSLRIPPQVNGEKARLAVIQTLTQNVPYNAKVSLDMEKPAAGWNAPALKPWLANALQETSKTYFGKPALFMGEGGTIPFMYMLGEKFPEAQFVVTGVLGPNSNAHGPNEFLHLGYVKKITATIAHILVLHCQS